MNGLLFCSNRDVGGTTSCPSSLNPTCWSHPVPLEDLHCWRSNIWSRPGLRRYRLFLQVGSSGHMVKRSPHVTVVTHINTVHQKRSVCVHPPSLLQARYLNAPWFLFSQNAPLYLFSHLSVFLVSTTLSPLRTKRDKETVRL